MVVDPRIANNKGVEILLGVSQALVQVVATNPGQCSPLVPMWSVTQKLSLRQLFAGLLTHHVFGVPSGPVRICLANALLMITVRITE
jgi:hypothetical protein